MITWNSRLEASLVSLWNKGMSARLIAEAMGPGFTRNAVIGKAHRLNLEPHKYSASRTKRPARISDPKPKKAPPKYQPRKILAYNPILPKRRPPTEGITIQALKNGVCRAIIDAGQGETKHCGEPTLDKKTWCAYHASIYEQSRVKQ
jgi:GcrA cell cycle regulator